MADSDGAGSPPGSNGRKRAQDEPALAELSMRDRQVPRTELAPAPQRDVEIEHARAPAAAAAAAELAFNGLESRKHLLRLEVAFGQRHRIGEIAPGGSVRRVEHDRRSIEQAEVLVQAGDSGLYDAGGTAMSTVRTVRSDRNGV